MRVWVGRALFRGNGNFIARGMKNGHGYEKSPDGTRRRDDDDGPGARLQAGHRGKGRRGHLDPRGHGTGTPSRGQLHTRMGQFRES